MAPKHPHCDPPRGGRDNDPKDAHIPILALGWNNIPRDDHIMDPHVVDPIVVDNDPKDVYVPTPS